MVGGVGGWEAAVSFAVRDWLTKVPCPPLRLTSTRILQEYLAKDNAAFVQPASARNEVLSWVKSGLRDFSISRANVKWGIPVPQDGAQTVYVWFDALVGYLTALLQLRGPEKAPLADLEASGWPASVHVIGKDILRFHAVYWPAMLMAAGARFVEWKMDDESCILLSSVLLSACPSVALAHCHCSHQHLLLQPLSH